MQRCPESYSHDVRLSRLLARLQTGTRVARRSDARPSTSPIQLSPGVHLPIGTATSTSAVSCAATMPQKANKDSKSRESEWKKECFCRENWRHRNYLPEPAIFRHPKLRL